MKAAFIQAYRDLFVLADWRNKPTVCSRLNELYGLNDMDMNKLVDRLKSDQHGIRNWENFFMRFASRPDFYNRLTIFGAQMREDGTWDAHSLNSEGILVYDFKKDKRFTALINNDKSNLELYNEQKGLYISMAKQFVIENAKYQDGTEFVFEFDEKNIKPLPRAYTTLQSESMKEIADNIYGYYTHEKKSMIHATFLGTMWMQFRTYWSGKKNQYLGTQGVKLRGRWKTIEGYCYDENGQIIKINEDGSNDTKVPVKIWEGDWQEGILLTMSDLLKNIKDSKSIESAFKDKWYNEDPKLRRIYRNNMQQLLIDLIMWIIIGSLAAGLMADWLKELKEEKKDGDIFDQLQLSAAQIACTSVTTSFYDFNFIETVGAPVASWTPFAFEWAKRTGKKAVKIATGDKNFIKGIVELSSVGRQFTPVLDTLIPDKEL